MAFDFGESKPSDPTADFLAREREAAGVLSGDANLFGSSGAGAAGASADDFERSASAFPALDDDGIPAPATSNTNNNASSTGAFGFDDKPEPASATSAKPVDDEVGKFEHNFPELDDGPSTNTNGASYHDDAVSIQICSLPNFCFFVMCDAYNLFSLHPLASTLSGRPDECSLSTLRYPRRRSFILHRSRPNLLLLRRFH